MTTPKNTPTLKQRDAISILLFKFCAKSETRPGFAVYAEGYSDERIASEAGCPLCIKSVRNMRLELYGNIREPATPGASWREEATARLTELEAWRDRVERALGPIPA